MKSPKRRRKGVMFAAMTDLFMNFALALAWVLFVMPVTGSSLPDAPPEPVESKDGDRPSNGLLVATVSVDREKGEVSVNYRGEQIPLSEFLRLGESPDFPDHLVFKFSGFPEYERIAAMALDRDCAVSLKLSPK
jgi:hypothetical protein